MNDLSQNVSFGVFLNDPDGIGRGIRDGFSSDIGGAFLRNALDELPSAIREIQLQSGDRTWSWGYQSGPTAIEILPPWSR